jgi:formylglycine-generating enzyme
MRISMKNVKLKNLYLPVLVCMFVLSVFIHMLVHAAQTIPGVQRLEDGIAAYEHGEYDDAIFKLEMAKIQISEGDKESLWKVHYYSGLSYYLTGDNEEAKMEFTRANEIFNRKLPDSDTYSPKIVKIFKDALELAGQDIEMVLVKGGCFKMGNIFGDGSDDEEPVHEVCVDDFYIGKYEVKVEEYMKYVKETGVHKPEWQENGNKYNIDTGSSNYYKRIGNALTSDNYPIVGVSWNNAVAYAKWLSTKTGKNYRLPTEAEWEYAARSGGKREKYVGTSSNSELNSYAWYDDNSDRKTHPVGQKKPNGLGLYDMAGNVWEWCQDWYGSKYYDDSPINNPKGPSSGSDRISRGGSWYVESSYLRSVFRSNYTQSNRNRDLGLRLARTLD